MKWLYSLGARQSCSFQEKGARIYELRLAHLPAETVRVEDRRYPHRSGIIPLGQDLTPLVNLRMFLEEDFQRESV